MLSGLLGSCRCWSDVTETPTDRLPRPAPQNRLQSRQCRGRLAQRRGVAPVPGVTEERPSVRLTEAHGTSGSLPGQQTSATERTPWERRQ